MYERCSIHRKEVQIKIMLTPFFYPLDSPKSKNLVILRVSEAAWKQALRSLPVELLAVRMKGDLATSK